MTLHINGTPYGVRPVQADDFAAVRAYRLRKADGTVYDVAETLHGLECDCPDFVFHRDGIDPTGCKHVKALVAVGLLGSETGRMVPDHDDDDDAVARGVYVPDDRAGRVHDPVTDEDVIRATGCAG